MSDRKPKIQRPLTKLEKYEEIATLLEEGYSSTQISEILSLKFGVTPGTVSNYISDYWRELRGEVRGDLKTIISTHLQRYEQIYRDCNGIEERWNDPTPGLRSFLIAKWDNALRALQQKERLLGLHRKDMKIKVRNLYQADDSLEIIRSRFSFKKLDHKQLRRVLELLEKCRENPYPGHHPLVIKQERERKEFEQKETVKVKNNVTVEPSPVKDIPLLDAPSSPLSNKHILLQEEKKEFLSPEQAAAHYRNLILQKHLHGKI